MSGPAAFGTNPYAENRPVDVSVVTVLHGIATDRGLQLEQYRSRAVVSGAVHELMVTDEPTAEPESRVDHVGLIAFVVVETSGVILVGSDVEINGNVLGTVAGFDDTHMPNHQNICIKVEAVLDGLDLDLNLGTRVRFQ